MNYVKIAAALVLIGLLGYAIGRYVQPAKVVTQEKEVEVVKHDTVTQIKEVTRPDGTKEKDTTITDRSTEVAKKESKVVIENLKPQWMVSGTYGISAVPYYGAQVQRRIIGPVFAGVAANTRSEVFAVVSLEF